MNKFLGKKSHAVYLLVQIAFDTNLHSSLEALTTKFLFGSFAFSSTTETSDCIKLGLATCLGESASLLVGSAFIDTD